MSEKPLTRDEATTILHEVPKGLPGCRSRPGTCLTCERRDTLRAKAEAALRPRARGLVVSPPEERVVHSLHIEVADKRGRLLARTAMTWQEAWGAVQALSSTEGELGLSADSAGFRDKLRAALSGGGDG